MTLTQKLAEKERLGAEEVSEILLEAQVIG